MEGKDVMRAVGSVLGVAVLVVFVALILGTILGLDAFNTITIINVTDLQTAVGGFLTAIFGFFALAGTVIAIVWIVGYIRKLFDKKTGLNSITA